jgi:hypothetical protein
MLDGHPDLAVSLLGQFPVLLWPRRNRYLLDGWFDLSLLAADLLESRPFQEVGPDPDWLRERLCGKERLDYAMAMRRVFALYAEARGKGHYGHKSPALVVHVDFMARLFEEARFVHIIRDGRDVALSLLSRPWGPVRIAEAARYWATRVEGGRLSGRKLSAHRYLEVRYEDLVTDPKKTLRRICDFVELDYRSEMLTYPERGIEWMPQHMRSQHTHLLEPPRIGVRDWRTDMTNHDVALFEAVAGNTLRSLGYERRFDPSPVAVVMRARVEAIRTRARWLAQLARKRARHIRSGRAAQTGG